MKQKVCSGGGRGRQQHRRTLGKKDPVQQLLKPLADLLKPILDPIGKLLNQSVGHRQPKCKWVAKQWCEEVPKEWCEPRLRWSQF